MANASRGEIAFEADGKSYTLQLEINEIAALEGETAMSVMEIFALISNHKKWSITFARAALFIGLRKHHPEITRDEAGDLIVPMGGLIAAIKKVSDALQASFPTPEKTGKRGSRPPKGAGTGSSS